MILEALRTLTPLAAFALFFAENVAVLAVALVAGHALVRAFAHRRITAEPPPIIAREVAFVCSTVFLNAAVTFAGWELWRRGLLTLRTDASPLRALRDCALLFVAMDLAMYVLHRVAHVPLIYRLLHAPHHAFDRPRPLTLFVLHPFETVSFGALWIAVLLAFDPGWLGISLYLTLNVVFGVVGHLGVEPLPDWWRNHPLLGLLAGGTFHARHHEDGAANFGFYTLVWDRLFGTCEARPAVAPR